MRRAITRILIGVAVTMSITFVYTSWAADTATNSDLFGSAVAGAVSSDTFAESLALGVAGAGVPSELVETVRTTIKDPGFHEKVKLNVTEAHASVFSETDPIPAGTQVPAKNPDGTPEVGDDGQPVMVDAGSGRGKALRDAVRSSVVAGDSPLAGPIDQALTTMLPDKAVDGLAKAAHTGNKHRSNVMMFAAAALAAAVAVGPRRGSLIRNWGAGVSIPAIMIIGVAALAPGFVLGLFGAAEGDIVDLLGAVLDPLRTHALKLLVAGVAAILAGEAVNVISNRAQRVLEGRSSDGDGRARRSRGHRGPKVRKARKGRGKPQTGPTGWVGGAGEQSHDPGWVGGPVPNRPAPDPVDAIQSPPEWGPAPHVPTPPGGYMPPGSGWGSPPPPSEGAWGSTDFGSGDTFAPRTDGATGWDPTGGVDVNDDPFR